MCNKRSNVNLESIRVPTDEYTINQIEIMLPLGINVTNINTLTRSLKALISSLLKAYK